MKLINPKVEIWQCGYTLSEIWSHIAKCARVCYQSEPRNNGETDEEFVRRVILRNHSGEEISKDRKLQLKLHLSVLEQGTIYLDIPLKDMGNKFYVVNFPYQSNPYTKCTVYRDDKGHIRYAITTNMRVIIENGAWDEMYYLCAPTQYHCLRTTFNIITDIGVARELDRHRSHSISEESTRFCNYSKDKFNNELTFIKPEWLNVEIGTYKEEDYVAEYYYDMGTTEYNTIVHLFMVENGYKELIRRGFTPQEARQLLPLSTKVQTIHTAFNSDWEEFIKLRADACSGSVHPNMKDIACLIRDNLYGANAG